MEPRPFTLTHDPRHAPYCWCRWVWCQDRWGPCTRDGDTEDAPEDILYDQ